MNNLNKYPPLTHATDLQQICKPLESLGIIYFAQVKVNKQNEFSAIGVNPEFVRLYLDKAYYNYDIHMAAKNITESYVMWDLLDLDNKTNELNEDSKSFDLHHSFTIIQQGELANEYYHFATSINNHQANANYLRHLEGLKKFIYYFKDKIHEHKQLKTSHDFKFVIEHDNTGLQTIDNKSLSINRIFVSDTGAYLTQREFECLYWLSLGKTFNEISMVLSVAERTIKAHVCSIKEKTGCYSLFQLGALYQKLKFII
jgi:DNA-binding CsgD family transcriptional regulator